MREDLFGQPTTLETQEALEAWNEALLAFLAHGAATAEHLGVVLQAEPQFALGHAVKGLFMLLLGRRELNETAVEALATAKAAEAAGAISWRERRYILALEHWVGGAPLASVETLEGIMKAHPDDPLAMKLSHAIRFVLGDSAGMRASIEAVLPAYALDHRARGYLLGCHSFALEETGDYAAAETAGREALWTAPDDAWGLHAVAHVYDMTGNPRGGIDWLSGRESAWAHCNNFRYHVWWHRALMHLDIGEVDTVLALYDTEIRRDKTDDYRDISNAASLLSRLELDGVNVGDRWEELADISAKRTEDGCLIFADLHYLLALVGDCRQQATDTLIQRLRKDGKSGHTEAARRMADPGIAAAEGLHAFGEADYEAAFLNLSRARGAMQRAGGSHAQRDVFERLTIDAGLRAGFLEAAETMLADRQRRRGGFEDGYAAARKAMIAAGRLKQPSEVLPAG
ncbi:MAG: tetratricopeptide repeat protein [Pseudomonadota bacterium]